MAGPIRVPAIMHHRMGGMLSTNRKHQRASCLGATGMFTLVVLVIGFIMEAVGLKVMNDDVDLPWVQDLIFIFGLILPVVSALLTMLNQRRVKAYIIATPMAVFTLAYKIAELGAVQDYKPYNGERFGVGCAVLTAAMVCACLINVYVRIEREFNSSEDKIFFKSVKI